MPSNVVTTEIGVKNNVEILHDASRTHTELSQFTKRSGCLFFVVDAFNGCTIVTWPINLPLTARYGTLLGIHYKALPYGWSDNNKYTMMRNFNLFWPTRIHRISMHVVRAVLKKPKKGSSAGLFDVDRLHTVHLCQNGVPNQTGHT